MCGVVREKWKSTNQVNRTRSAKRGGKQVEQVFSLNFTLVYKAPLEFGARVWVAATVVYVYRRERQYCGKKLALHTATQSIVGELKTEVIQTVAVKSVVVWSWHG